MNTYLAELEAALASMAPSQRQEVLDYYREYLLDAGLSSEAAIARQLGTPKQLARQTLAEYGKNSSDVNHFNPHLPKPLLKAPILGLIGLGVLILALITIAFGGAGLVMVITAAFLLNEHLATAALFGGLGLVGLGIAHLLAPYLINGYQYLTHGGSK